MYLWHMYDKYLRSDANTSVSKYDEIIIVVDNVSSKRQIL